MSFRFVLWVVGMLLAVASRTSARLRKQLTRDMSVSIGSRDGVSRSYVFRNRRVSSHAGLEPDAHCTLLFQTAPEGARIFLAPDCLAQVVNGLALREIELKGDPTSIVWFYEMVMAFAPGSVPSVTRHARCLCKAESTGESFRPHNPRTCGRSTRPDVDCGRCSTRKTYDVASGRGSSGSG